MSYAVLTRLICDNYVKSIGSLRSYETAIWSFLGSEFLLLEKIQQLEVLDIPKFLRYDNQILRKIKFGNFRRSKSGILVILEALNFDS